MRKVMPYIFLLVLTTMAPVLQGADSESERIDKILSPVLDSSVLGVARLDLQRIDIEGFLALPDVVSGSLGRSIQQAKTIALDRRRQLIEAGGTEIFVVYSLTSDGSGPILLAIPLGDGAKPAEITGVLSKRFGVGKEAGSVQVGQTLIVGNRKLAGKFAKKQFKTAPRPEFAAGLAEGKDRSLTVVIAPSHEQRRVLKELLPEFSGELSRFSTSRLAEGVNLIRLTVNLSGEPSGELSVQTADSATASLVSDLIVAATKQLSTVEVLPSSVKTFLGADRVKPTVNDASVAGVLNKENQGVKSLTSLLSGLADELWRDASRMASFNSLKQLGLTMHILHDQDGKFPASAGMLKPGKPPVSWRVLALPHLDRGDLYQQYKLDEPWDSEHNRKLLEQMPEVFATFDQDPSSGLTTFQMPTNKGTIGGSAEGVTIKEVTDGTSNTVMIMQVDHSKAVPWTKPADFEIDPNNIALGIIPEGETKFFTAICDGSARSITLEHLQRNKMALFTIGGGEVIDLSE